MNGSLVVLGDLLLDIDIVGRAHRLSPEAPVPVLSETVEHHRPGGAGLAALLAARAHDRVVLIAPLAADDAGERLAALLKPHVELIALDWAGSTSVKTRIRAGEHPVTRLDSGGKPGVIGPLPPAALAALDEASTVLVADYGLGCTSCHDVRVALSGRAAHTAIVWDPHPRGAQPVPGARLVTPNAAEASGYASGSGGGSTGIAAVAADATELTRHWSAGAVAVTMGACGALLCIGDGAPLVVPAPAVAGSDTCGAGDAFAAAAAVALAHGALPSEAVTAAVYAAAEFVAAGAAAGFALDGPIVAAPAQESTLELLHRVRASGGRIVATGGCFDLLHAGHIATLEAARALGDCLVVCLNSDDSVRRLKGEGRPLQSQADRAQMLTALRCVDAVAVFDEDTPEQILRGLRPDVWVKGGDYVGTELPEAVVLGEWGGVVVTVPYLSGRSTTTLVSRARQRANH